MRLLNTHAAKAGTRVRQLIEEGLRLVLQRRRTDRAFELRDARVDGRDVQSGIDEGDWSQLSALIYEDHGA